MLMFYNVSLLHYLDMKILVAHTDKTLKYGLHVTRTAWHGGTGQPFQS